MPRFAKIFIGIIGMIFFVAVVVLFLGVHLIKKSIPQTTGTLSCNGIQSPVKIYRDAFGVPHIFAQNDADLFFAMGYVTAQDRLWQMDINRRAAMGTLSEIFGSRTLEIDRLIRTAGIPKIANELAQNISPKSKQILNAYAAGVNSFIEQNQDRLPNEFVLLQYKPQPWTVEHSLAYQRLMAWSLEMAWRVDPVFGSLVEKVGAEKTRELRLDYPPGALTIMKSHYVQFYQLQDQLNKVAHQLTDLVGFAGSGFGSNSWVISGEKSVTGKPMLANDPHLTLQCPSLWYEIHLSAPGIDCYGVSLPGIPGIVIGRNQIIAWGLTNVMADGCDFFIEKMNEDNPSLYLYQGKWHEVTTIAEDIPVKDQSPVNLNISYTHQGPIISDLHPALKSSSQAISMKWNGLMISDETYANYKIMKAQTWDDFTAGLQDFSVPAQNYIYADTAGNIGYYCAGSIPIRRRGKGLIPQPGWNKNFEWKNYIPFRQLPHLFNPAEEMIITANNKVIDDNYPYFITTYWEPPYRAQRIRELLSWKKKFSIDDFKLFQSDQYSIHSRSLMPIILDVLPKFEQKTKLRTYFCQTLQNWNYNLSADAVAPAIFEVFLSMLFKNIFTDEMGDSLYQSFVELPNIPIRITDNLLATGNSSWFDNIHTPGTTETMTDIILLSLEDTFDYLKTHCGETIYHWRWGNLHAVNFDHVLGKTSPLNIFFNIGSFPAGGSCTSVNNASYMLNKNDFQVVVGSSMRQIADLSTGPYKSLIVITTGQSGHPLDKHYKDQTQLWLNGEYHEAIIDSLRICNSGFDLLILEPSLSK